MASRSRGRSNSISISSPTLACGPLVIMQIRSDIKIASSGSCVIISVVIFSLSKIRRITSWSSIRVSESKRPSGSSKSNMRGLTAMARAIPTRCCIPRKVREDICASSPSGPPFPARPLRCLPALIFQYADSCASHQSQHFGKRWQG